jgi:hypothetical protein
MYAPIFRNVPTSPIDQPSAAWASNEGIDRGESLLLEGVRDNQYELSADPGFFIQADQNAPVSTTVIDEILTGNDLPEYRMLLEAPQCSIAYSGYDNIRMRCTSCKEAPRDPFRNDYVITTDSVAFNGIGPQNWSNIGEAENDIPLNGREVEAWRVGSNFQQGNLLTGVQRSTPLPFTAYGGAKELLVNLSEIEFNGRHYEQSGMAAGVGASLLRHLGNDEWSVVDADFRELNTGNNTNFAQLSLDLSRRVDGESYAVAIWRIRSLRMTTGLTQESWWFPGNVIGFEIRLRAPLPPPPPPASNACATAQSAVYIPQAELPLTTGNTIVTYGSTPTDDDLGCGGTAGDVWLTFEAESSQKKFFARSARDTSWAAVTAELLTGDCGNLTSLQCEFLSPEVGEIVTLENLTIGQRYYLRLTNSTGFTAATGRIRYHLYGEKVVCTPAQPVQIDTTCLDISNFTATIDVPSLNGQATLYMVNNFGDTLRTITAAGTYNTGPLNFATSVQLVGASEGCDSELLPLRSDCNTDPAINDECAGAFDVPITKPDSIILRRASGKFSSSSRATQGDLPGGCGADAGAGDIWFTAINTTSQPITPEFDLRDGGSFTDYVTYFYRGTSCGDLTYLNCSPAGIFSPGELSPGETLYLRTALSVNRVPGFEDGFAVAATAEIDTATSLRRPKVLSLTGLFPNPVAAGEEVRVTVVNEIDGLYLSDQLGRRIGLFTVDGSAAGGGAQVRIPSQLQSGVYVLTVRSGDRVGSRRLVVR